MARSLRRGRNQTGSPPTGKPCAATAIVDLKAMRQSHVDWAAYFAEHPNVEAEYVATGVWDDREGHLKLVAQYDNAIACLEAQVK